MSDEDSREAKLEAEGWPMLAEWPAPVTTHIRKDDYYGGDVWVDVQPAEYPTVQSVVIRWKAWGGYGATALKLSPMEVAAIAFAVTQHSKAEQSPDARGVMK